MPKRKKLPKVPDYEGMGNIEKTEIQKSRPLQSLSETDLTLPEFKILDAYLARINSHDPDKRTVRLEKGELERTLGVSRILKDDLNKRLRHLFQVIEVKDDSKRKGFKLINLFEEADAEQDDDGLWQITLTCTPSAREYIFNIDNIGYLRYRLKNVINLTSRYSYILYLYLENNRFRKSWNISLDELKNMLRCTAERYEQYKFFNSEILKKCRKELHEKTDLRFTYEPVKGKGRKVTAIHFTVETFADKFKDIEDAQQSLTEPKVETEQLTLDEQANKIADDYIIELRKICTEFSDEQIKLLYDLSSAFVQERGRIAYIQTKMDKLDYYIKQKEKHKEKPIKNKFAYVQRMIQADYDQYFKKEEETYKSFEKEKPSYDIEEWDKYDIFEE